MTQFSQDPNGVPIEALQPVPGGTQSHNVATTAWAAHVLPAGTQVLELEVSASCEYVLAHATYVPTANEAPCDQRVIQRLGVGKGNVLHIKARVATAGAQVNIRFTGLRAAEL